MPALTRMRRSLALAVAALFLAVALPVRAADPYQINAILSLTGTAAFVGTPQAQALKALESYVNRTGGIDGRPVAFVVADDQSNPQVAVQLAQGLIAKHVSIILGPSLTPGCNAVAPLVNQGPIMYCFSPSIDLVPGSYVFATMFSMESMISSAVRYFRERGWKRIAYIVSADSIGQAAEHNIDAAIAEPENASVRIVAREHFANSDISVAAQLASIEAAHPDALIAYAVGTPAATVFRGAHDAGINLPTFTGGGNLTTVFLSQYQQVLPTNLYFAGLPYYGGSTLGNPATRSAIATLTEALKPLGVKPDQNMISAWDPALLLVDALRKVGSDATATQLRAYIAGINGWVGANGPYDFHAVPQRGISKRNVIMVRWNGREQTIEAVSKLGGGPLSAK